MISLIVNTAAGENTKYAQRAYALQNFILPQYLAAPYINEVIVVGSWHEGDGYQYISCPSKYFSAVDALEQRQRGFEASSGDVVIFQHDDHVLDLDDTEKLWHHLYHSGWFIDVDIEDPLENVKYDVNAWDVLSPARYTRLRTISGERLNNGEPGYNEHVPLGGHLSGHCAIFRREVIERCPWTDCQKVFTWDVSMTQNAVVKGFKIVWTDAIRCWDVEEGSQPWT